MKNYEYIFAFGDSHVAGDELVFDDVPGITQILSDAETFPSGEVKRSQKNFNNIQQQLFNRVNLYYGNDFEKIKLLNNSYSFVNLLAEKYKASIENHGASGASVIKSFYIFVDNLSRIKQVAELRSVLIIFGVTEYRRTTRFLDDLTAENSNNYSYLDTYNFSWDLEKSSNRYNDAISFLEITERNNYTNDDLSNLYALYGIINGIKNMLPENVDCVFVDSHGIYVCDKYISLDKKSQNLKNEQIKINQLLKNIMFKNTMADMQNILGDNHTKRQPLGHYTRQHHQAMAELLWATGAKNK